MVETVTHHSVKDSFFVNDYKIMTFYNVRGWVVFQKNGDVYKVFPQKKDAIKWCEDN